MSQEMPTFMATTYGDPAAMNAAWVSNGVGKHAYGGGELPAENLYRLIAAQKQKNVPQSIVSSTDYYEEDEPMSDRRLVRVLVVDPHEDVPTEDALLYDSKEVFTDKTDQELYFDVPMAQLLTVHNEKRTKIVDKSIKDRTEHLEPARIRDLKMLVITLAEF